MNRKTNLGQVHITASAPEPKFRVGLHYRRRNSLAFRINLGYRKCDYTAFRVGSYCRQYTRPHLGRVHIAASVRKPHLAGRTKLRITQNELYAEFTLQHVHRITFRVGLNCVSVLRINQLPQEQYRSIFKEFSSIKEFQQHQGSLVAPRWK